MIKNLLRNTLREVKFNTKLFKDDYFDLIFIIGCARSGTSILGQTLSQHSKVFYLHEPRHIWHKAYPEMDIWSEKAFKPGNAKLYYDESDYNEKNFKILKREFHKELIFRKKSKLIEKLPINNFRLELINKSFPNAKFIYLHRNGLEVAQSKSIGSKTSQGQPSRNNLKFNLLMDYACNNGSYDKILPLVRSDFEKGLFEWRLSMDLSDKFFTSIERHRFYSLSYSDFLENPTTELENMLKFIRLEPEREAINYTMNNIKRSSKKPNLDNTDLEIAKKIGGTKLNETIENTYFKHSHNTI